MNRVFLVRVGADTTYPYPIRSPVFEDNSFEFVPIPEGKKREWPIPYRDPMLRYCEIRCLNDPKRDLGVYLGKYSHWVAHNDPEFVTKTYGDVCEEYSRARNLIDNPKKRTSGVEEKDYLFFLARLDKHNRQTFTGSYGLYFIGYFHVENVFGPIERPMQPKEDAKIGGNAHVLRAKADPSLWADKRHKFWIFKGNADSVRFHYALETKWDWLSKILRDTQGRPWKKKANQSDLQRITSYTRTIRCHLDPRNIQQRGLYQHFWGEIERHLNYEDREISINT